MTKPKIPDFMVWIDTETTGLEPLYDTVLELGIVITDLNLNIINSEFWVAGWGVNSSEDLDEGFVRDTHTKTGLLLDLIRDNDKMWQQEEDIINWLSDNLFDGMPVLDGSLGPFCGSTVGFDKTILQGNGLDKLVSKFNYRCIDVSSIKELAWRWNPRIMEEGLEKEVIPQKIHRTIPDLQDSIEELKFYQREFLLTNP